MIVLGIETSCDETSASVVSGDKKILSNIISSQIDIHRPYGGVVPEIASRSHVQKIDEVIKIALEKAGILIGDIDAIAATAGPGLIGGLIVGLLTSKAMAISINKPLIAINHLEAHALTPRLTNKIEFPYLLLLVSGGHTQIWNIINFGSYELLGETRDDAAGEAFDKGARILGLGYPGGPEIEKLAKNGDYKSINFPRALLEKNNLEFSFSGLKTSLLYYVDKNKNAKTENIAASYQYAIIDVLVQKLKLAVDITGSKTCVIAGGVAANKFLRRHVEKVISNKKIVFPDLSYCTDNAAMIAFLGEKYLKKGKKSNFNFSILPNMRIA